MRVPKSGLCVWQRCNGKDIGFPRRIGSLAPPARFFGLGKAASLGNLDTSVMAL